MSPSKLTPEVWPVTSTGQPGVENQDAVLIYQPTDPTEATYAGSLYVVASGRGGSDQGHIASQYAVRKVMESYYRSGEPDLGLRLHEAFDAANADLLAYNQSRPELVKLSVALTAVVVRGEQLHAASVGDGRAYLIRDNHILRITTDHTLVQQLLDEGAVTAEEARNHPRRDVLLRTLGTQDSVSVDVYDVRLHPDDALIVCTSGMVKSIDDEDIAGIVASKSPQNAAEMLVQSVRAGGSKDNIAVVTALLRDGAPPMFVDLPHTWDRRPPSFEEQQTLAMPRGDRYATPGQVAGLQSSQIAGPAPIDRDSPAAQTRQPAPPPVEADRTSAAMQTQLTPRIDRSTPGMQTQVTQRPAQPPDDSWGQPAAPSQQAPGGPVPAPAYQSSVQPAPYPPPQPPAYAPQPSYQPPAYPPQQQPAYPQQPYDQPPAYDQPRYQPPPGSPQYAPPGYAIDPVTGLPPVPQSGQPYGGQPGYSPRIYQPPAQPNVRGGRRGLSIGTFAIFGAIAVFLVAVMVVVLLNPFGLQLPFAAAPAASATPLPPTSAPTTPPTVSAPATSAAAPGGAGSPAAQLPTLAPTTQAVPPNMALVAGGAYTRGVSDQEAQAAILSCINEATDNKVCLPDYFKDAQPVDQVTISPFYMDIYEVTNRDYAACLSANVCTPLKDTRYYNDPNYANHPVVFVNWEQAGTYCQWLGKRLPTEAEWEKAARWDPNTQQSLVWPWGNTFAAGIANVASSGQKGTRPVGSFPKDKSPWGMFDMGGNVTEWTSDWYFKGYANLGTLNPTGPAAQPLTQPFRSGRGGSFQALASYARAGQRFDIPPQTAAEWVGFRCAEPVAGAVQPTAAASVTPGGPTETPGGPTATEGGPTATPGGPTPTAGGPTPTTLP